jgi:hypothetical protein
MKVTELFESEKMAFEATFKVGKNRPRLQQFTHTTIKNCKALTYAEIKRALKLEVGASLNARFSSDEGPTSVVITRKK